MTPTPNRLPGDSQWELVWGTNHLFFFYIYLFIYLFSSAVASLALALWVPQATPPLRSGDPTPQDR